MTDRHPTLGDAADRRVPERDLSVHHPTDQILPLMRDAVIGRKTAIGLVIAFLVMIVVPGSVAVTLQLKSGSVLRRNWQAGHGPVWNENVSAAFLENTELNKFLRRTWGSSYSKLSGNGVGNVLIGKDGYLFYLLDFDICTGGPMLKSPDQFVANIVDYDQALKARGIHLILLPVPAKTAILPFELCPTYPKKSGPALNPDYRRWIATLGRRGVDVVDTTDEYWAMSVAGHSPYLTQDSHWTPDGMEVAAMHVAERARPYLGTYDPIPYTAKPVKFSTQGDLVGLLGLAGDFKHWPPMSIDEMEIFNGDKPATAADDAKVLIIGDSYTAQYSFAGPVEPGYAGIPHHLMLHLGTGVQFLAGSGAAYPGARQALALHPEMLRQKKVVIWEFTSRELPQVSVPLPTN